MAPPDSDTAPDPAPASRPVLAAALFAATCLTTFWAGAVNNQSEAGVPSWWDGLLFSAAIMGILLVHEMGHYLAARRHRVPASLPYFLPVPFPPVGTFGAVIIMRDRIRAKNSLMDIGAAGPLAGLVVCVVVCYLGLRLSPVVSLQSMPAGSWIEGNSIVYMFLKYLAHPDMGPHQDVWMHPLAWAGWLGILVTSINLLPAGQLDGGHILYALVGPRRHSRIARIVHLVVFGLGMLGVACTLVLQSGPVVVSLRQANLLPLVLRGTGLLVWLVWTVLLYYVGRKHPPVEDEDQPLTRGRLLAGITSLLVLILTFTPVIGSPVEMP